MIHCLTATRHHHLPTAWAITAKGASSRVKPTFRHPEPRCIKCLLSNPIHASAPATTYRKPHLQKEPSTAQATSNGPARTLAGEANGLTTSNGANILQSDDTEAQKFLNTEIKRINRAYAKPAAQEAKQINQQRPPTSRCTRQTNWRRSKGPQRDTSLKPVLRVHLHAARSCSPCPDFPPELQGRQFAGLGGLGKRTNTKTMTAKAWSPQQCQSNSLDRQRQRHTACSTPPSPAACCPRQARLHSSASQNLQTLLIGRRSAGTSAGGKTAYRKGPCTKPQDLVHGKFVALGNTHGCMWSPPMKCKTAGPLQNSVSSCSRAEWECHSPQLWLHPASAGAGPFLIGSTVTPLPLH